MQEQPWIYLNNQITLRNSDGSLNLEKDKEAAHVYFREYVNKKTVFFHSLEEKLDYLIEKDYYINFYDMYIFEDIKDVFKLVYSKEFRFGSYMSAYKFYSDYIIKDGVNYHHMHEFMRGTYPIHIIMNNC